MKLSWIADTSQGRMVGDYISTSFAGGLRVPGLRHRQAADWRRLLRARRRREARRDRAAAEHDVEHAGTGSLPGAQPARRRRLPHRQLGDSLRRIKIEPTVGERGLRGRGLPTIAVAAALGLLFVSAVSAGSVLPTPISDDPYTDGGTGHQHKTQVEPDSYAHGQTIVALTQSGRWYAGGGASNLVFSSSQNGGRTWTTGGLPGTTVNATPPGPWPRISDPSIAYDPEHNVWLALGLGINAGGTGIILLVNRSTDGGADLVEPGHRGASRAGASGTRPGSPATRGLRARSTATATSSSTTTAPGTRCGWSRRPTAGPPGVR